MDPVQAIRAKVVTLMAIASATDVSHEGLMAQLDAELMPMIRAFAPSSAHSRLQEAADWGVRVAHELNAEWKQAMENRDLEYANRLTALRTRIGNATPQLSATDLEAVRDGLTKVFTECSWEGLEPLMTALGVEFQRTGASYLEDIAKCHADLANALFRLAVPCVEEVASLERVGASVTVEASPAALRLPEGRHSLALRALQPSVPSGEREPSEQHNAFAEFEAYFVTNYPADTVIGVPQWHAPKIWRAAIRALRAPQPIVGAPSAPRPERAGDLDLILANERDRQGYAPYCLRCSAMVRMQKVEAHYWRHHCGAECDLRDYAKIYPPASRSSGSGVSAATPLPPTN